MSETVVECFWRNVAEQQDGCLVWVGGSHRLGYGEFRRGGGSKYAHRWMYEYLLGPVPEGLELDHLCRNRACVNVVHLEPVTHQENCRRAQLFNRTAACRTCGSDDWGWREKQGTRYCRPCSKRLIADWKSRQR